MSIRHANKMQLLDVQNTSLVPYPTCANQTGSISPNDCLPNWLAGDVSSPVVPTGVAGMLCPQLTFLRTQTLELTYTSVRFNP